MSMASCVACGSRPVSSVKNRNRGFMPAIMSIRTASSAPKLDAFPTLGCRLSEAHLRASSGVWISEFNLSANDCSNPVMTWPCRLPYFAVFRGRPQGRLTDPTNAFSRRRIWKAAARPGIVTWFSDKCGRRALPNGTDKKSAPEVWLSKIGACRIWLDWRPLPTVGVCRQYVPICSARIM